MLTVLSELENSHLVQIFLSDLKVPDVKWLLVDVDRVSTRCQAAHSGQVPTVAPHRLNDEHSPLGATS